jgi:hypothetical protein
VVKKIIKSLPLGSDFLFDYHDVRRGLGKLQFPYGGRQRAIVSVGEPRVSEIAEYPYWSKR